jgi:hypothetical protein
LTRSRSSSPLKFTESMKWTRSRLTRSSTSAVSDLEGTATSADNAGKARLSAVFFCVCMYIR